MRTAKFVELELERTGVTLLVNTDRDDVAAKLRCQDHLIEVDCVNPLLKPKVCAPQRLIAPTPHLAHAVLAPQALFTRFMGDKEPSQTQQGSSFSEEIKKKFGGMIDVMNTSSGLREKLHDLWQDIKQEGDTILAALGADCSSDLAPLCVEYHNLILEGFGPFKGKVEYKFVEESNRARGFVFLTGERTDSQVFDGRQERAMQSNGTGKSELPHA